MPMRPVGRTLGQYGGLRLVAVPLATGGERYYVEGGAGLLDGFAELPAAVRCFEAQRRLALARVDLGEDDPLGAAAAAVPPTSRPGNVVDLADWRRRHRR
jgi:hypothetical protein